MSTSTSSNKIIDSSLKKKIDKNLLKSSSASIVQKSNYDNYLNKITSFKNKTRNKNKNSNFKLSFSEIEQKNPKNNILYNNSNNISGNKKLANNISFKIINHSSKNSCNINKKFVKTLYQRKKIGEIIKVNTNNTSKIISQNKNTSNNKIHNSEKLTKNYKNFNNKIKEIGKTKLFNLKQIGITVNSVRHSVKLNKEKKVNYEFENELYKNNTENFDIEKITTRCLSSKLINSKNNIILNNLNFSSSNSVKDLSKLEKKDSNNKITTSYNNCTTSTQNEILTSERDLEGPEIIHFSLVELIQKGNKKMNDLANQFEN